MKKGWRPECLGDIAVVSAGNSAPQDESLFKNGTYPFFRTADAGRVRFGDIYESSDYLNEKGVKGLRRYPKGTILFPKSGASTFLNHRVMLGVDGYVSSHLATIVADKARIDPRFLLYFLSTIAAQDLIQDHAYPSLNLPTISGIEIPTPPISEQRRIVGLLDEAFACLATTQTNAEKNLRNARAVFESYLENVCVQRGSGYSVQTLGDVCDLFQGLAINSKSKHLLVKHSSLPLLRIKDLRDNSVEQYVAEKGFPPNAKVEPSEIIYTRTGQVGLVFRGRSGILHNNVFKVRPRPEMRAEYLFWWLQNPQFRQRIMSLAGKAAQPDISHAVFKTQAITVPPLAIQDEASAKIELVFAETQRLVDIYERKLTALQALRRSLLHEAFNGRL